MLVEIKANPNILYVFGGEKAQGAEIVIERLISFNVEKVNSFLVLSPGNFATALLEQNKAYQIDTLDNLKKLNRSTTGKLNYYSKALTNYLTIPFNIYKYIKKNKIDIIHANTFVTASYLIPLIIFSKIFLPKLKWYWSDHDLKFFSKIDLKLSKLCVKLYHKTLIVSNALKEKYSDIDDKNIVVLYNGLDLTLFKSDEVLRKSYRQKWDIRDEQVLIGIAGSINPDKGQLELIEVFNRLLVLYPDVRLIIAGAFASHFPDYEVSVRAAMESNKKIVFAGFITNVIEFYNGCDIIINNSNHYRSESLGTTIYEAMACKKIVIASRTGGTPEIITDEKDGYLFKTEDQEDLLQTLIHVVSNFDSLDLMRTNARQKAVEKFDINCVVSTYNKILNIT